MSHNIWRLKIEMFLSENEVASKFRDFIMKYSEEGNYPYREFFKEKNPSFDNRLEIQLDDLEGYDINLASAFEKNPAECIVIFENAAPTFYLDFLTYAMAKELRANGLPHVHVTIKSRGNPTSIGPLGAAHVSKIVRVSGVVMSTWLPEVKQNKSNYRCSSCEGMNEENLPRFCSELVERRENRACSKLMLIVPPGEKREEYEKTLDPIPGILAAGQVTCMPMPSVIITPTFETEETQLATLDPEALKRRKLHEGQKAAKSPGPNKNFQLLCQRSDRAPTFVDVQIAKIQELPKFGDKLGAPPKNIELYLERTFVNKLSRGQRVNIVGIYNITKKSVNYKKKSAVGVFEPHIHVLGIEDQSVVDYLKKDLTTDVITHWKSMKFEEFYKLFANSIAPSVHGLEDIKKAIVCSLFGGSRKRLPDKTILRGDVHLLLIGDPGTAKSQLLKFITLVSPNAIYTSGKGSSAAGLTATVNSKSRQGIKIEPGALIVADNGHLCLDEADKMNIRDSTALHEAMEQGSVSIAKAGVQTKLRTRTTIIAAANSVFGRWDDTKKKDNVVNFVPSLLSRFDLKFIIRDKHNEESDIKMAKHVMDVHSGSLNSDSGTLHPELMRKYIDYCRKTCAPRITAEAGRKLSSQYVILRKNYKDRKCSDTLNGTECMGVRQLEGLIRLTEALAKMQLRAFADTTHAEEAIRLFRISMGESVDGIPANDDLHQKCEEKINRLIPLGAVMSHEVLIAHLELVRFTRKTAEAVAKNMTRQGKLQYRALKHEYFRLE